MNYWNQKAASWVSVSVLAVGLVSAGILFLLVKIDGEFHITLTNF